MLLRYRVVTAAVVRQTDLFSLTYSPLAVQKPKGQVSSANRPMCTHNLKSLFPTTMTTTTTTNYLKAAGNNKKVVSYPSGFDMNVGTVI